MFRGLDRHVAPSEEEHVPASGGGNLLAEATYGFRNRWLQTAGRRITLLLCLVGLVVGGFFTQYSRLDIKYERALGGAMGSAETFYLPPNPVLRVLSLGRDPFLADIMFIRAYMYFLSHLFTDRIFEWLDTYIEAIIYLDPDNPRIYRWAGQVALYGQKITNEAVKRSIDYARRGAERFPNDWRFYMDIGFNLHFEYRAEDAEERERIEREALEYFSIAARLPNSELDPNFITELYQRRHDTQMALFQAYRAYHDASEQEREQLRRRIARLESAEAAQRFEMVEEVWREQYPFLPFPVFELLGTRHDYYVPSSWLALLEKYEALR